MYRGIGYRRLYRRRPVTGITGDGPAIQLTGLSRRFGELQAVASLDLTVQPGEVVALLGPNGAGKSTTLSLLLGLARPDAGSIRLFGSPPSDAVRRGRVGVMLQDARLPQLATVAELIGLGRALHPRSLPAADVLTAALLTDLTDRRLDDLSGGQAQRAKLGFALAGDPELLVLDEPSAGMDVATRRRFWESVRHRANAGCTVLFATHDLAEAEESADRVVVLAKGRVVADGPAAEVKRAAHCRTVSFDLTGTPAEGRSCSGGSSG